MDHFWKEVPGFFTFPEFYTDVARRISADGRAWHGVEVGVYEGQSAAYLAVELATLCDDVPARLDLVDNFGGQAGADRVKASLSRVANIIGDIVVGDSAASASRYPDASLDFVFIDADHSYESVSRDIDAWRSKVRPGGILAGHDFALEFPGVIRAVTERFNSWRVWRGINWGGDARMQGNYYPCWEVGV